MLLKQRRKRFSLNILLVGPVTSGNIRSFTSSFVLLQRNRECSTEASVSLADAEREGLNTSDY